MKTKPFYVYALSLDLRSLKAFEIFFTSTCKNQFSFTDDRAQAGAAIIDFDSPDAEKKLKELRETLPRLPVIVITLIKALPDDRYCHLIRKPIKHTDLRTQLEEFRKNDGFRQDNEKITGNNQFVPPTAPQKDLKAAQTTNTKTDQQKKSVAASDGPPTAPPGRNAKTERTETEDEGQDLKPGYSTRASGAANFMAKDEETRFVGSLRDIDINDENAVAKVTYSSKNMFQGALKTAFKLAIKNECPVEVIAFGIGVVVDPENHKVHTAANDSVLRPICMLETGDPPKFRRLAKDFREQDLYSLRMKKGAHLTPLDIEAFVWKVTLWSSRGRVPDSTDFHTPVYLSHWPNLTRLAPIPHAARISALMVREPAKLDEIAKNLNLPQRYVFGFYSGAKALGYAGMTRRQVDTTFEQKKPVKQIQSRSILSKLLGRLTGKNISTQDSRQAV